MKRDALFNMIEQQIRPWDVLDSDVLDALRALPRAGFVPESHRAFAYMDTELPLVIDGVKTGVQLLAPRVMARIVQAVAVHKGESVAQVGLGEGYLTALLARFSKTVTVFEWNETVLQFAQRNLNAHAVRNVNYEMGDGLRNNTEQFDVIVLAGSVASLTDDLKQKIIVGGRLFAIVGRAEDAIMSAILVTRTDSNTWESITLFETAASALCQIPTPSAFAF